MMTSAATRCLGFTVVGMTLFACVAVAPADEAAELRVTSDFAGGSVRVETIDQARRVIRLSPQEHEGRGWACWWYFHVSGLHPGETITLEVVGNGFTKPERAAYSLDNQTWQQSPPGERVDKDLFRYALKIEGQEAWFAWGPPFVLADAKRLVREAEKQSSLAKAFTLCKSREGRDVPAVRIGEPGDDADRPVVWIQARQHAWESGSSWVAQGLLEWLVSDDARAEALRRRAVVVLVPIMDVDNVTIGAGGKRQLPQDHNRDWSDKPHWPEVAAAQAELKKYDAAGRLALFIDLHNPGAKDRTPYFYVAPETVLSPERHERQALFLSTVQLEMTGPLAFDGKTVVSDEKYDPNWQKISGNWVSTHTNDRALGLCLETPWNTPHSTPEGYCTVGRQLGLAVERYLRK